MTKCSTLPDPTSSSLVTFRIPKSNNSMEGNDNDTSPTTNNREDDDDDIIQIRTYPYHNDVGVAKVWEAGACLAEYIIYNLHCVKDKNVVELGAGVGLTGLIAAGYSGAKSIHMTDYTEVCLDNLGYNVDINEEWLRGRGVTPDTVTVVSKGLNLLILHVVNTHLTMILMHIPDK
jgi:predicted nicotinamide N-methyase